MRSIRRVSTGDRMDNAAERRYRRGQSEAGLVIEQAQAKQYEQSAAVGKRQAEDRQPYQGSRLEATHRG